MAYLSWDNTTLSDFSEETINDHYNRGFVFGRPSEGYMDQTRSMRIKLGDFMLSSENRRILRKTEEIEMAPYPLPCTVYTWEVGKLGKDFYDTKFGDGTMSANKIKELMTGGRQDFNRVLVYKDATLAEKPTTRLGYCIGVETKKIFHYSYPFYDLDRAPKNMGMGMMLKAIVWAQEQGKEFIYLGSAQRPGDVYKLQFAGLEWFDGGEWTDDLDGLKELL